jgi:hypothetical protein
MFAKEVGLGTLDFQPIFSPEGAARYVSKYLTKSLGEKGFAREIREREPNLRDRLGRKLSRTYVVQPRCFVVTEPPDEPMPGWTYSPLTVAEFAMLKTGEVIEASVGWYELPASVASAGP